MFSSGPLIYEQVLLLQRLARSNGLKLLQLSQRLAERSQHVGRNDHSLLEDVVSIRLSVPVPKKRRTVVTKEAMQETPLNQREIVKAEYTKSFLLRELTRMLVFPPLGYVLDY